MQHPDGAIHLSPAHLTLPALHSQARYPTCNVLPLLCSWREDATPHHSAIHITLLQVRAGKVRAAAAVLWTQIGQDQAPAANIMGMPVHLDAMTNADTSFPAFTSSRAGLLHLHRDGRHRHEQLHEPPSGETRATALAH
jgi:hypothetical protein